MDVDRVVKGGRGKYKGGRGRDKGGKGKARVIRVVGPIRAKAKVTKVAKPRATLRRCVVIVTVIIC